MAPFDRSHTSSYSLSIVINQRRRQSTGTKGGGARAFGEGGGTWRAREARAYNGGLGAEPLAGSRGRVPGQVVS